MTDERFQRAENHRISGEYDSAIPLYRSILAEDENNVQARVALGMTLGFIGEFDDSIAELERATHIEPHSAWAQLNLGKTYQMLGKYEESKDPLQRVLEIPNADQKYREEAQKQLEYLKAFGL